MCILKLLLLAKVLIREGKVGDFREKYVNSGWKIKLQSAENL